MACSCVRRGVIFFVLSGVALAALVAYLRQPGPPLSIPDTAYWGPDKLTKDSPLPADDPKVYKMSISYDAKMVSQLREELGRTKWVEPLDDAAFHYGVNLRSFRNVIDHWRSKFDFKQAERDINVFPHYHTQIEGLKIHFFRSAPVQASSSSGVQVLPLLMVHGWPGSFVEFLKVAKMLSKPVDGVAFDVIVPSIPGYGFSQAASKQGMNVAVTARIFRKLMERLGYSKFYMQGGDWGSSITSAMGALYPEKLRGIHLNMVFVNSRNPIIAFKNFLVAMSPATFGDGPTPPCMPSKQHMLSLLRESGYLHIQATKPDTVGFGLLNSPAGLAAYILEKFSTWTQDSFRNLEDGGLGNKLTLDELLANVMVYYASNSIVSSQRYYRENFASEVIFQLNSRPITVPTGYAVFPNELACFPRFVVGEAFSNLTTMTYQNDGGHFAAFEQPTLLEKDVRAFVGEVEKLYPEELKHNTFPKAA